MPKSLIMRRDNAQQPPQSRQLVILIILRILREKIKNSSWHIRWLFLNEYLHNQP